MIRLQNEARSLLQVGAALTGFGVVTMAFDVYDWRARNGADSPAFLWIAASLALGAWATLRRSSGKQPVAQRSAARTFSETALFATGCAFGLLALAASPTAGHPTKETASVATMRSDLRNLASAEDQFFADSGRYTLDLRDQYSASGGTIGPKITLTSDGWTATVAHEFSPRTCAMFTGTTPLAPAVRAYEPGCTPLPPRSLWSPVTLWGLGLVALGVLFGAAGRAFGNWAPAPTP